ncbi:MAG: transcription termination factor NusA [Alphaproteobacteria bacterium]
MEQSIRTDMLTIASTVAREKGIEIEQVIEALESAIQKAAASRYGLEFDIRAKINRDNGSVDLARFTEVVANDDELENEMTQITLAGAKVSHPGLSVGEFIIDELPPIEFGRIAAQTAKQVIVQKVRDAERERQYESYKDRVGEILTGTVKRVEYNSITVDLGMAEAVMLREESMGREQLRRGDRVRAYLYDVRREQRGPQIFVSRTHPQFLVALFKQEVPEIEEGTIEILNVARDPGSRAKMCVRANETGMDPVGSCVGMRGSRVQQVVSELLGEKIDIIEYIDNQQMLIKKALQPAEVSQVIIDEMTGKAEVVVDESQLSLAIGRRGQNVRLASQMLKIDLDIITEEESQKRNEEKYKVRSEIFQSVLGVDDVMARLLVQEGFTSVEDFAMIHVDELMEIEGITETVATSLQEKAKAHIEKEAKEVEKTIKELKVEQDLIDFIGGGIAIVNLAKNDVKSLEDLADLAADELQEFLADLGITEDEAANIIMQARESAGWFDDEPSEETTEEAGE